MEDRNLQGRPWRFRRRLAISVLLFCAAMSIYAMTQGVEMTQAVLPTMATVVSVVLGTYFGGAVYEDTRSTPEGD